MNPVLGTGLFAGLAVLFFLAHLDARRRGRFSPVARAVGRAREARSRAGAALEAGARMLAPLVLTIFPEDVRLQTRRRLVQAGLDHMEAEDFLALKFVGLLCAVLGVGFVAVLAGQTPLWGALAAGPGYVAPEVWLSGRHQRRRAAIEREAPDFAVLLSAVLSAGGVGLNEALRAVAERLGGELGREVERTFREISAGRRRGEALENLAERCGVAEVSEIVRCVRNAERFGVPIAEALREMASQVYALRRARAEEQVGKAAVKVIFPMLVFFIIPLFAILFFPALSKLKAVLGI